MKEREKYQNNVYGRGAGMFTVNFEHLFPDRVMLGNFLNG